MDVKALQLAARFALPPNSLGYCGKDSAPERFKKCFIHDNCNNVEDELDKFIVLHPYLRTISETLHLPKYSYQVVEAYWLGNELLSKFDIEGYELLLKNFTKQGVPDWLTKELKETPPQKFIPHHLFQVLFVGVGKASDSVPFNLDSINSCMIRWGKVNSITHDEINVELNSLTKDGSRYKFKKFTETLVFVKNFLPSLKNGDNVAVHWKQPVKILNDKEVENLTYWTQEVISSLPLTESQ